ncbi:efflux RND transporter periplasmic adaptor subunit [Devosia sp.]|uniref:efflux RND transporter periplasmic adaptor subunit n=1 Tax=Devosia sp. TaxID=1871048 RepID=UPI002F1FEB82
MNERAPALEDTPGVAEVLAEESRRARRRRIAAWSIGVAGVAVLALIGWWWWSAGQQRASAHYVTEPVARADILETVVATGTLEPTGKAEVSSAISGTIATVDVEANDRVSRKQVLARLEMGDLDARLAHAVAAVDSQRANMLVAEAGLADAEAALRRAQALAGGQSVSVRELELAGTAAKRAQATLALSQAQLRGAEADLQAVRNDYDKACICSPIDGVVLEVDATVGQSLAAAALGNPLFLLAEDLSRLELQVDVDEADIGKVREGDTATFSVEAWPDRQFTGVIEQIRFAPVVVEGVVSYRAVLRVDNAGLLLRPGMTATAEIVVAEAKGVLSVPSAALRFQPQEAGSRSLVQSMMPTSGADNSKPGRQRSLWVLREGRPVQVQVTVGLTDGQRTEIAGGPVAEGEAVVVGAER